MLIYLYYYPNKGKKPHDEMVDVKSLKDFPIIKKFGVGSSPTEGINSLKI